MTPRIKIFCDGSALIKGEKYTAAYAVIVTIDDKEVYSIGDFIDDGTVSRGEALGMYNALKMSKKIKELNPDLANEKVWIVCDSLYVVNVVKKWLKTWSKNGYKKQDGETPMHLDIFKKMWKKYLAKDAKDKKVKILHIKSHVSNIDGARRRFQATNNLDVEKDDFYKLIDFNNDVDSLADRIRTHKIKMYEKIGDDTKWEVPGKRIKNETKTTNGYTKLTRIKKVRSIPLDENFF